MQLKTENEHKVWAAACLELEDQQGLRTSEHVMTAIDGAMAYRRVVLDGEQRERVRRALEEHFVVSQGSAEAGSELQKNSIPPWVPQSKPSNEWPLWYRYQKLMKGKISPQALEDLDSYTDRILDKIGDPKRRKSEQPATWDIRGMVAGHVQSGKTSNYVGLICKAADSGYKMIVVLSGIHENLRVQTHGRIDEGFIGRSANGDPRNPPAQPVGVGNIIVPGLPQQPRVFWGTTQRVGGDFRTTKLDFGGDIGPDLPPVVLVVKKNVTVLRTLLKWIVGKSEADLRPGATGEYEDRLHDVPYFYRKDCPILVVDDEADQASVDTNAGNINDDGGAEVEHDPTKINRLIRSILRSFDRSAYVGYTATPFANILIHDGGTTKTHGDDLFPRDFIVNLPTPAAYVGPSTIFGLSANAELEIAPERGLPELVVEVDDHAKDASDLGEKEGWMPPVHKQAHEVDEIPESLQDAMFDWVLAGAALVVRGKGHEHHSMLIHVTRFQDVMGRLQEAVQTWWEGAVDRINNGHAATMASLRARWNESFVPARKAVLEVRPQEASIMTAVSWADLTSVGASGLNALQTASAGVKVLQVHGGDEGQALDYRQQLKVIAIGGNKLSRGLTLENLTVSYFLRTSKMYDTLMQMGRWFGYRPGFLDLCRLYMPEELRKWFLHMSNATEELRGEFERMASQGATPKQFGLRVRSHPVMAVTSSIKMRHGERVRVTFSDTRPETTVFDTSINAVKSNWNTLTQFIEVLGPKQSPNHRAHDENFIGHMWSGVSHSAVVQFLSGLKTPESATTGDGPRVAQYISMLATHGELVDWTVFLRHNNSADGAHSDPLPHGLTVGRSRRGRDGDERPGTFATRVLIDSKYESLDLTDAEYAEAVRLNKEEKKRAKKAPTESPGPWVRHVRAQTKGLLLLYTVQPSKTVADKTIDDDPLLAHPLVGFAVSFPVSQRNDVRVEYVVGNVYRQQQQREQTDEVSDG